MIYLASPYSNPDPAVREDRFRLACRACGRLMREGHHVYSPIALTHPIAVVGGTPTDFKYWHEYDYWFVSRCDAVWVLMLPGWEDSLGVAAEIVMARDLGIEVEYLSAAYAEED